MGKKIESGLIFLVSLTLMFLAPSLSRAQKEEPETKAEKIKKVEGSLKSSEKLEEKAKTASKKLAKKKPVKSESPRGESKGGDKAEDKRKKPPFGIWTSGYFQAGYRMTLNDPKLLRLGDSDGFFVRRARIKINARLWNFALVTSIDGAYDHRSAPLDLSPSTRRLYVELRDAYLLYRNQMGFFFSFGQFKVPFGLHSLRSTADEHFILFPLIEVGEDIAFGYQVRGIVPGRDIGFQAGFSKNFGKIGFYFSGMVYNGNGSNKFGNDSDLPAVSALTYVDILSYVKVGGSFLFNPRKVGKLPNLYDETDIAFNAFLELTIAGFFFEGEFAGRITQFPTTGQADDFAYGFHADAGYRIRSLGLEFAGRFELYDPSSLFNDDQLIYVTLVLGWYYRIWHRHEIAIRLSYTIKLEQTEARNLNNDQFNLLIQYRY